MITWEVKIMPLNIERKEASVVATRTDSVTGKVEIHRIITCILGTQQQKINVLDQLWQMHLDYITNQALIDTYIGDMENEAKINLEGRE